MQQWEPVHIHLAHWDFCIGGHVAEHLRPWMEPEREEGGLQGVLGRGGGVIYTFIKHAGLML